VLDVTNEAMHPGHLQSAEGFLRCQVGGERGVNAPDAYKKPQASDCSTVIVLGPKGNPPSMDKNVVRLQHGFSPLSKRLAREIATSRAHYMNFGTL
jgi:hypothetical protein